MNEHASKPYMMVPPPTPRRKRRVWLHVLLALLILVCGIVIGAGATLAIVHRMVTEFVQSPERMADRMAHRMERRLRLSDEQAEQVEAIIKRRVDALLQIRRDIRPRLVEQFELLDSEMSEVLDDEQMEQWDELLDRVEKVLVPEEQDE